MLIRVWRSGVPFLSPAYQTVGHECTVDEAAPPKYLLPWTPHCVKCRGEVLQQYGRIRYTEESFTRQPIALISMRCHRCLALCGYDTVTVGEGEDEEVYRLSLPRDHIVLARHVFGRPYVHELQQRIVLQFASFQAEGGVKEVPRTKLQEGPLSSHHLVEMHNNCTRARHCHQTIGEPSENDNLLFASLTRNGPHCLAAHFLLCTHLVTTLSPPLSCCRVWWLLP